MPSALSQPRTWRWLGPLLVALLSIAAHAPASGNGFVDLDDQALLVENDAYRGLGPRQVAWAFSTTLFGHYQPLTWLSFTIDHEFWGLDPIGFHATNVLIHAIGALLLCLLATRLIAIAAAGTSAGMSAALAAPPTLAVVGGIVAAAFWAIHPLRVESVAWVTERRDVLSGALLFAAGLAYLRAVERRRIAGHALAVALLALSLLSKAWGMTFFALLLVIDLWPLRRCKPTTDPRPLPSAARLLAEKAPYAALGIAAAIVAALAQRSAPGAVRTLEDWPLADRVAQALHGLTFYLQKTISPSGLVPLVELPPPGSLWAMPGTWMRAGAVVTLACLAISLRRRAPALLVALATYAILLSPVLGVFQSGDQLVADRYAYLAAVPVSVLLGACLAWLAMRSDSRRRRVLAIGGTFVGMALVALTWAQARVWRDPLSLWSHAVEAGAPGSAVHVNLALALEQAGRGQEAIERLRTAVAINPRDGRAWYTLGAYLRRARQLDAAEQALRRAAEHLPQAYIAWTALGNLLFNDQGRREDGLAAYRAAVADLLTQRADSFRGRQLSGVPYLALGVALKKAGDMAGARDAFTGALAYPDSRVEARAQLNALPARDAVPPPTTPPPPPDR
ncbi:MAG: tetratricopeptide repeat protein [Phycisphaerae bacterium]|nr:tetratricopeptide repeat protein [Phycisphaerae bacterium]